MNQPIGDAELVAHLARRSAGTLTPGQRATVLALVAGYRRSGTTWAFRPISLIAPVAAALILAVVLYPILLTLGAPTRQSPSPPAASILATASSVPTAEASASRSPDQSAEPTVYTAQELSDMIGDPSWMGRVVLANAQISHMMAPPPDRCHDPSGSCEIAFLADVTGKNVIDISWRDASVGAGVRFFDESVGDVRWLQVVGWNELPGLKAFKIQEKSAQYLGPVVANGEDLVWPVTRVPVAGPDDASDDLYAVGGWLLETIIASCPAPVDYGPDTSTEYWCGGSFLTDSGARSPQPGDVFDPGGLHVQWGAYQDFAPSPSTNRGQGTQPRRATYLVRQAACQPKIAGECPVWRMVGRLD